MKAPSKTSARAACSFTGQSRWPPIPCWKWSSRCRKKFRDRKTVTSFARAASRAPAKRRRNPPRSRERPTTPSGSPCWRLPSSTTNSSASALCALAISVIPTKDDGQRSWPSSASRDLLFFLCSGTAWKPQPGLPGLKALPANLVARCVSSPEGIHLRHLPAASKIELSVEPSFPRVAIAKESSMKKKSLRISASSVSTSSGLVFVLAIGVLAIGLGCARKPNDAQISSEIENKFSQDSGLSSKQLTVQASSGVVTLAGAVDNDAQREAAARQAGSVSGVKEVINNLQVGVAANTPQPAPVQPEASASPANNPKPGPGKKTRRSHSHDDSAMANGNDANQNTNQNAANQNADQQAGQTADQTVASNNATPSPPPPAPADTAPPTPPPPPPPKHLIIDQGTQLTVRLVDPIDSEKNQTGDTFHATLNTALTSDGEEAIPAGTDIVGHLVNVKSAGKFAG